MKRSILVFIVITTVSAWAGYAEGMKKREKLTALQQCEEQKTSIVEACGKCWLQCTDKFTFNLPN